MDTLGFQEEEEPAPLKDRGGCWFRDGEAIVHMGIDSDFAPQRKARPAFLATEIAELAKSLEEEGFAVKWDDALPERKRFYASDPFGNRIEFMQDGQGFSQK